MRMLLEQQMYTHNQHTAASNTPTVQIAKTDCYELYYNESKNRIYAIIYGYWKDCEAVPDYLNDWEKALQHTQPHFTVLSDLRTMITHPPSLNNLHLDVQNLLKESGAYRVAQLEPADRIATLQINQIVAQSSILLSSFSSRKDAEDWLDGAQAPATTR